MDTQMPLIPEAVEYQPTFWPTHRDDLAARVAAIKQAIAANPDDWDLYPEFFDAMHDLIHAEQED